VSGFSVCDQIHQGFPLFELHLTGSVDYLILFNLQTEN